MQQYLDTLRGLNEAEEQVLVRRLEAEEQGDQRAYERYLYTPPGGVPLDVECNTAKSQFLVRPRNLSAAGIAVFHGGFVYPNSKCVLHLRTLDNELQPVAGRVVRCRCVQGRVHELGIAFNAVVDPERFVSRAHLLGGGAETGATGYDRAQLVRLANQFAAFAAQGAPVERLRTLLQEMRDAT